MIYEPVDWEYFVGDIDIEPQNIEKQINEKFEYRMLSKLFRKCNNRWLCSGYRSKIYEGVVFDVGWFHESSQFALPLV